MNGALQKTSQSPDETLAETIANAIKAANLVSDQKLPRIRDGLAKGTLSASEWKLIAELSLPTDQGGKQS
jgi:hypothetical protein